MNVKTIVIGLTTLGVVASTWWAQESVRRRPRAEVVELVTPRLRRHDQPLDPQQANRPSSAELARAVFRDESNGGLSSLPVSADPDCPAPAATATEPSTAVAATSMAAVAAKHEPASLAAPLSIANPSSDPARSPAPANLATTSAALETAPPVAAAEARSPVWIAPLATESLSTPAPTVPRGTVVESSAPPAAAAVNELAVVPKALPLAGTGPVPGEELELAPAAAETPVRPAEPANNQPLQASPAAPQQLPLAGPANLPPSLISPLKLPSPAAAAAPPPPPPPVAAVAPPGSGQVWGSEPVANANDTLWPRGAEQAEPRVARREPPSNSSAANPEESAPLIPSLRPAPPTTAQPAAATLSESLTAAAPIATRANPLPEELVGSPPANGAALSAAVLQRARGHLEYGRSLASRGSLYSARAEFQAGLKLVVESLDAPSGQPTHAQQFDQALRALREAEDFVPSAGDDSILMPLVEITRAHQSQILSPAQCPGLTPMKAMQAYYSYASAQLAAACGDVPVASELLYALGKLYSVLAREEVAQPSTQRAVSLVMYQAALAVDPRNYKSANELGVAYAKLGYFQAAKTALLHSLSIEPTVHGWANLAYVHRQLGEENSAVKAERERQQLAASQTDVSETASDSPIRWVTPAEFSYPGGGGELEPVPAATTPPPQLPSQRAAPEKQPMWDQFKNAFRTQ